MKNSFHERYRYLTTNRIQEFQFVEDGRTKSVDAPVTAIFDSMDGLRQAIRDGLGIGWSLRAMIEADISAGTLETVLDPYMVKTSPYYIFYPEQNRRFEPPRLFLDLLIERRNANWKD